MEQICLETGHPKKLYDIYLGCTNRSLVPHPNQAGWAGQLFQNINQKHQALLVGVVWRLQGESGFNFATR